MVALGLMPTTTNAADPALYTLESSAGRTCTVEVDVERTGGFLVLRRIEFNSVISCDSVAGSESPVVGGAILALYDTLTEPLGVVLTYGERSGGFGYTCDNIDIAPCVDEGQFPLSLAGSYYAQSGFAISLAEGETWTDVPEGCVTFTPETVTCALRSTTLNVGLLH